MISHLLFADDYFIFDKADIGEVMKLMQILDISPAPMVRTSIIISMVCSLVRKCIISMKNHCKNVVSPKNFKR